MADVTYRIEVVGFNGNSNNNDNDNGMSIENENSNGKLNLPNYNMSRGNVVKQSLNGNIKMTNLLATIGMQTAVKATHEITNLIGLYTGDSYLAQSRKFNLNLIEQIGGSALSGFIMSGGNPMGALISGSIGTLKLGVDALLSDVKANIKRDLNDRFVQEQQRIYNYSSYGANRTGGVLY